MSYAVRKDGQGWRAVGGIDDCLPDENFSETQPELQSIIETKEDAIQRIYNSVEMHIHTVVVSYGYLSLDRLTSVFTNSPNAKWKSEAVAAPKWVTAIWEHVFKLEAKIADGKSPTNAEVIASLPVFADYIKPVK